METIKARICPFCGHHGHELLYFTVDIRYEDGEHDVNDIWQMECRCCGARGPTEYTPRLAVESWNALYRKPAHGDDPIEVDFTFDADSIRNKYRKDIANGKQDKERQ